MRSTSLHPQRFDAPPGFSSLILLRPLVAIWPDNPRRRRDHLVHALEVGGSSCKVGRRRGYSHARILFVKFKLLLRVPLGLKSTRMVSPSILPFNIHSSASGSSYRSNVDPQRQDVDASFAISLSDPPMAQEYLAGQNSLLSADSDLTVPPRMIRILKNIEHRRGTNLQILWPISCGLQPSSPEE